MPKLEYKFIFLLHVSRSGSTFLSRLLAENVNDLAVISETNYFRIIISHQKVYKKYQPEKLARLIMEDPKFKAFQYNVTEIRNAFLNCKTHKEAIFCITEMILNKLKIKNISNVLIKDGGLINFIPEIASQFEGVQIIHIKRDPRGCINSLLHTPKAFYKSKSGMGWDDIKMCVNQYKSYFDKMKWVGENYRLIAVQYEDLVHKTEVVLNELIKDLNLKQFKRESIPADMLRTEERIIHKNVYKPAQIERTDAWKYELQSWEILYIEVKLQRFINASIERKNKLRVIYSFLKAKRNRVFGFCNLLLFRIKKHLLNDSWDLFFLKLRLRFSLLFLNSRR